MSSIERSLEKSDWLILLASKSGSKSPWVEKEIEYWCNNKPINHLLLVLTDGELVWDNLAGDFDWLKSTAISRRLAGQLTEEPLWLDLRWARKQPAPTLRNPPFQDAVASLAAPLRSVSKDELIGMDIRQHQQLQRWRNIAFLSLMLLLISAIAAAELARRQRNIALERETEAVTERARAERQATISQARQLAAQSVQTRLQSFGSMELNILPAVESTNRENALEGRRALVQSLALTPQLAFRDHHSKGAFQHEPVWAIAYSYDGQLVVSAGDEGSVVLHRNTGDILWQHRMSHEPLQAVAFHPNGKSLATASQDGTASLWRVDNGELIEQFNHDGPVVDLAFDNSGGLLATASMDGTARVWEVDNAIEIGRLSFGDGNNNDLAGVNRVAFSTAGDHVAAITKGGQVCLWNIDSRSQSHCMFAEGFGTTLAFSTDGRKLGTASENFVSIWNVENAELLYRFEHPDLLNEAHMEHFLWIQDIAFHPGGRFIVSAGRDSTVRLWDLISGQETLRIVEAGPVSALDFSPNGQLLVTTTDVGTIRIWKMLSARELSRSGLESSDPVTAVSFSPDETQVAAANMASAVGV